MCFKLALRNLLHTAKDFLVYFVTVMLTVALIFAFNSLVFSRELIELSSTMDTFRQGIVTVSCVMVLIVGMLINYTNSFILKKRKQEFGLYLLMGMERRKVSRICMLELVTVGAVSLAAGILFGAVLAQVFTAVIMHVFASPYRATFSLSGWAVLLTVGFVALIYLFVLWRSTRYIKRARIVRMMQDGKRNEGGGAHAMPGILLMAFSLAVCGAGIYLIYRFILDQQEAALLSVTVCVTAVLAAVLLFYYGLSAAAAAIMKKCRNFRYRGTNLFLTRQLTSKLRTNGLLMGGIGIMLTLTFAALTFAMSYRDTTERLTRYNLPFDVSIATGAASIDYTSAVERIRAEVEVAGWHQFGVFDSGQDAVYGWMGAFMQYEPRANDPCVLLSDYNRLRELLGYPRAELGAGGYLLHVNDEAAGKFAADTFGPEHRIRVGEEELGGEGVFYEPLGTNLFYSSFVLVVADSTALDRPESVCLAVKAAGEVPDALQGELNRFSYDFPGPEGRPDWFYPRVMVRSYELNSERSTSVMLIFGAFYVALVFILMSAAILAIQQLSDSAEHRERFDILRKLGVEGGELARLVLKQLAVYFLTPALLPVLLGAGITGLFAGIFGTFMRVSVLWLNFAVALGIFTVLYGLYFAVTYFGFLRNIAPR